MIQKLQKTALTLLCMLLIGAAAMSSYNIAFAQQNQQQQQPKANIINSKYLTIKDQRFRNEEFSNSITGTVVNNSTQQISSVHAYVILYGKNNRVIALENELADVSTLKPGDDSAFKISLSGLDKDPIDHYTLIPSGTP